MKLLASLLLVTALQAAPVLVLISANAEWRAVKKHWPQQRMEQTPYGETFELKLAGQRVRFLHGGWGKVAKPASGWRSVRQYRRL